MTVVNSFNKGSGNEIGHSIAVFLLDTHARTELTKYKGFCARLGPRGRVDLCKGYWNSQRKMGAITNFFRDNSLECLQKC